MFTWHYINGLTTILSQTPLAPMAYIDPNTGGMLFQLLAVSLAFFSGILFFFSRQIKSGFARLKRMVRGQPETEENTETLEEHTNGS